jgi:hypothetical protein
MSRWERSYLPEILRGVMACAGDDEEMNDLAIPA